MSKRRRESADWESVAAPRHRSRRGAAENRPRGLSGKRLLKEVDRQLRRFEDEIGMLSRAASHLDHTERDENMQALESLRREALALRAEVRELMARQTDSWDDTTAYVKESWVQLRDSYARLERALGIHRQPAERRPAPAPQGKPSLTEEQDDWFDLGLQPASGGTARGSAIGPRKTGSKF